MLFSNTITMQQTCLCNELCNVYTKISSSPSGTRLVKTLVNKCSKSSKKNICNYFTESIVSYDSFKEPVEPDVCKITTKVNKKSEFEKIKEEILISLENIKLMEELGIKNYAKLEKIIAYCFRIRIKPYNYNIETLDSFKNRLMNFKPNNQLKNTETINLVSTVDFPYLTIKNNTKQQQSKNKKNNKKSNKSNCLIFTNTNSLAKCSIEDNEDEELDDNPFDMEFVDSDNDFDEDYWELDKYADKDLEF